MDKVPLIVYDEEDVQEGVNSCSKSLVGHFLTEKPIHANSLPNALAGIWCNPKGFKVEDVGDKTYQFLFAEEKYAERILQGSPWIFRNSWLSLKRWERGQPIANLSIHIIPLKIQIWGLPLHCRTSKMGRKIGACMGEVNESELFEIGEKGSFFKVTVLFDSSKPLKPGINVGSKTDGITWVDFQYERLPQFCFSCGLVGHDENTCKLTAATGNPEERPESNFGPWLRTTQKGRKIYGTNHGGTSQRTVNRELQIMRCLVSY
ncbi:Zinc knuckle CX2CX4HX4C [Sesbania bispinosa]|nr:Zinc knuckle CX2CX4HX4C [Sesbania bispinosa]